MQNESTALTTKGNTAITTGIEGYQIKPNLVKLMQTNHLSKYNDAVPGAYRDVITNKQWLGELKEGNKLVPIPIKAALLQVKKPKVYFKPGSPLGSKPICRSSDGVRPIISEDLTPQSDLCSTCQHNKWDNFHKTRKRPTCQDRPWLLFIDVEDELPYFVSFTSKSIKNFDSMVERIIRDMESENRKNAGNPEFVPYNLYDYILELGSYKDVNDFGQFYVAKFENLRKVKVENKGKYRPYYEKYVLNYNPQRQQSVISQESSNITDAIEGELLNDI